MREVKAKSLKRNVRQNILKTEWKKTKTSSFGVEQMMQHAARNVHLWSFHLRCP